MNPEISLLTYLGTELFLWTLLLRLKKGMRIYSAQHWGDSHIGQVLEAWVLVAPVLAGLNDQVTGD